MPNTLTAPGTSKPTYVFTKPMRYKSSYDGASVT